jgi:hypothetical protein
VAEEAGSTVSGRAGHMAIRTSAEMTPWWIAPILSAQRWPEFTCSYVDAADITPIALFVHGDRNGWH